MTILQDLPYGAWAENMQVDVRRTDHGIQNLKLRGKSKLSMGGTLIRMQRESSSKEQMALQQGSSTHNCMIAK